MPPEQVQREYGWFRDATLSHMRRLQEACRKGHIEVLYAVIENATVTDAPLDYKVSGLNVPGSSGCQSHRRTVTRRRSS